MTGLSGATHSQAMHWLGEELKRRGIGEYQVSEPIAEADQREYYRAVYADGSKMLMHILAEPARRVAEVLRTTDFFAAGGIRVPQIDAHSASLGLMLLEDFGDTSLWSLFHSADQNNRHRRLFYYKQAVGTIGRIQKLEQSGLSLMNEEHLVAEMRIFTDWLPCRWLGEPGELDKLDELGKLGKLGKLDKLGKLGELGKLSDTDKKRLDAFYRSLAGSVLAAPRVCVHRDFHSRNLFFTDTDGLGRDLDRDSDLGSGLGSGLRRQPGVLDYQGVMVGHFCYDLVSLLNDVYTHLTPAETAELLDTFCTEVAVGLNSSKDDIVRQFNAVTLQRFIKVCGQFVRLALRDQKEQYISFLPAVAARIDEALAGPLPDPLQDKSAQAFFTDLWKERILPALHAKCSAGAGANTDAER